jgi:endonuclease/exonuclease/phosphatase (EEP) superfamily protein YafD
MRGPNIYSYHFFVKVVIIKQKLSEIYKKKSKPVLKWNETNLQNPSKLKEYRSLLHNKLIDLVLKQEINDEWEQIKTTVADAARHVIQTQGKSPRNEWWDEECKEIIQEKNEARKKLHLKAISWNTYINRIKQATKICTQKKMHSNKITQMEENHRRNETKMFFEGM